MSLFDCDPLSLASAVHYKLVPSENPQLDYKMTVFPTEYDSLFLFIFTFIVSQICVKTSLGPIEQSPRYLPDDAPADAYAYYYGDIFTDDTLPGGPTTLLTSQLCTSCLLNSRDCANSILPVCCPLLELLLKYSFTYQVGTKPAYDTKTCVAYLFHSSTHTKHTH